jgi:hypothetical protein
MSHETGKVEIVGVDHDNIYLRYHRATSAVNRGRFMIYRRDDEAIWLDDLVPAAADSAAVFSAHSPYDVDSGPE